MAKCRILDNNRMTQKYKGTAHQGVDMGPVVKGKEGDPIYAHSAGKIVSVVTGKKNNTKTTGTATYGNYVKIQHDNGYYTLYAHMRDVYVKKGQVVTKHQNIGTMGNSGNSYGAHLHFEVRNPSNVCVNPEPYLAADLPANIYVVYSSHENGGKWLPQVVGASDYAGNFGNSMDAFTAKIVGADIKYRVHTVGGKWYGWVTKSDVTDSDGYAGVFGKKIDKVQMSSSKKKVTYRVHLVGGGWLGWVTGYSLVGDSGYAGITGKAIDAIQIKIQ